MEKWKWLSWVVQSSVLSAAVALFSSGIESQASVVTGRKLEKQLECDLVTFRRFCFFSGPSGLALALLKIISRPESGRVLDPVVFTAVGVGKPQTDRRCALIWTALRMRCKCSLGSSLVCVLTHPCLSMIRNKFEL